MKSHLCDFCHNKIAGDVLCVAALARDGTQSFDWSLKFVVSNLSCCEPHRNNPIGGGSQNFVASGADHLAWCSFLCFVEWMKLHLAAIKCCGRLNTDAVNTSASRPARKELTP